jgi:signal transduction histidine kinase
MNSGNKTAGDEHTLSELLTAYADLQQRYKRLEELSTSKDIFFSTFVKDLESPLMRSLELIRFASENIEFFGQEECRETAEQLQNSLEDLLALLKNLSTWSGVQRKLMNPHPQAIDLGRIVQRNVAVFLPFAEDKHITLRNSIPMGTFVHADGDMMYAIIRNLLSNALKFSFPDDTVRISAARNEHELEVSVSDTGVGIEPENLVKIFSETETYHTPGTDGEEGVGFGLRLCKDLVGLHAGKLFIESTMNGTIVRFSIPQTTPLSK